MSNKLPFRYNYHKAKKQYAKDILHAIDRYEARYGYKPPKYLLFIRDMLELGYIVKLYKGGERGISKYVFIQNGSKLVKVRFSNHKPIKEYEQNEDCDYYSGVSHYQVSTTETIIQKVMEKLGMPDL